MDNCTYPSKKPRSADELLDSWILSSTRSVRIMYELIIDLWICVVSMKKDPWSMEVDIDECSESVTLHAIHGDDDESWSLPQ